MSDRGLIYHLPFANSLCDISGSRRDAVSTSDTGVSLGTGPNGKGGAVYKTTNGDGKISVPWTSKLNTSTAVYSCCFWLKVTDWVSSSARVVDHNYGTYFGCLRYSSNSRLAWWHSGSAFTMSSNITINLDEWNHVAVCYNRTKRYWYVNGILDANDSSGSGSSIASSSGDIAFMSDYNSSSGGIFGAISDFRFYMNDCLTQADVVKIYNGINSYKSQGG